MTLSAAFIPGYFAAMSLIDVLRGKIIGIVAPVVPALAEGGLIALETAINTPKAAEQICAAVSSSKNRLAFGGGTVTCLAELNQARKAGASFIVRPVVVPEAISEWVYRGLPD